MSEFLSDMETLHRTRGTTSTGPDYVATDLDNGVVVEDHLATTDPEVFAAGDVASAYYPLNGTRLEHLSAALNQGPVATANMVGRDGSYDSVAYFFSDQYDLGKEYSGYLEGRRYDEVAFSCDVARGEFIAFRMRGERVPAGTNVNVWDVIDAFQTLVSSSQPVDPADPKVSLDDVQRGALAGAR
jgi:3-phenylpropionate/trans-cinnamate dioxygenase ferredoxin reductase component